jgi:hypothetical protein
MINPLVTNLTTNQSVLNPATGKPNTATAVPVNQSTLTNPGLVAVADSNTARKDLTNINQTLTSATQGITDQQVKNKAIQDQIDLKNRQISQAKVLGYGTNESFQTDAQGNVLPKPTEPTKDTTASAIADYLGETDPYKLYTKYQQSGGTLNMQDWETQGRPDNITKTTTEDDSQARIKANQDKIDTAYNEYQKKMDQAMSGTLPLTADQQAQIDALKTSFDRARELQLTANKNYEMAMTQAGISAGRQRYAPEMEAGNIRTAVDAGITRLTELDQKATAAIATMRQGFTDNNIDLIKKSYDAYEKYLTDRDTEIQKMAETVYQHEKDAKDFNQEVAKTIATQQQAIQKDINGVISELAKQPGVPQDIISKVSQSQSLSEAVQNAGSYLQSGTGVVGEWILTNRERATNGQPPIDFNTYQNIDANRKAKASAIADSSGMTTRQNINFMGITNKFQADTIMATANQAKTAIQIAEQAKANPGNAGDQLTILYTLVKNLDPNSAVREGEISLAQTTQSYLSKFKTNLQRISEGKPISNDATKVLADATISLAQKWEEAGVRREKQYTAQAQVAGVGDAFSQYLGSIERPYDIIKKTEEKIGNFIIQSPQNEAAVKAYKKDNPNATDEQIISDLGIQ